MEGLDQIERIVIEMHRQKMTITKLAETVEASRGTIHNFLNRKANCTHEIVEKICNELGLRLERNDN